MVISSLTCLPSATTLVIPDGTANTWVGNYIVNKHPHLTIISNKRETEKIDFSIAEIVNFLDLVFYQQSSDGLRIYFANYAASSDEEGNVIMGNNVNSLTVVFAPTKLNSEGEQEDKEIYFGVNVMYQIVPISTATAKAWIKSYREDGKWQKLTDLLRRKETECILYERDKVSKLLAEIKCFNEHFKPKYITLFFAAYGLPTFFPDGTANGYNVQNQMCILFSIMDEGKEPFIITRKKMYSHYDTGTPCPPENNCLGSIDLT